MYRLDSNFRDLRAPSKPSVARSWAIGRLWATCCGCTGRRANDLAKRGFDGKDELQIPGKQIRPPEKALRMPTQTSEYDLDNDSVAEESSEAECELLSDEQTGSDQEQRTNVEETAPDLLGKSHVSKIRLVIQACN